MKKDMNIKITQIKQYNSTYKYLLLVDNEPVCLTKGRERMNDIVSYLMNGTPEINDGNIKKKIDSIRNENKGRENATNKTYPINLPYRSKLKKEYISYDLMKEHENQCFKNHGQSVDKLASRGGTDWLETYYIINDKEYDMKHTEFKSDHNDLDALELEAREYVLKVNKNYM